MAEEKTIVSENPVVKTAEKEDARKRGDIITLSTGIRVHLTAVSASLIEEVRRRIEDPPIPIIHDEEKDRDLPNPNDPEYLGALEKADDRRNTAVTDAVLMFGIDLVDGIPESAAWMDKLNYIGIVVDRDSPMAIEFAYKKYIAVGAPDLPLIYTASSPVSPEEVAAAMANFQRDGERGTDTRPTDSQGGD